MSKLINNQTRLFAVCIFVLSLFYSCKKENTITIDKKGINVNITLIEQTAKKGTEIEILGKYESISENITEPKVWFDETEAHVNKVVHLDDYTHKIIVTVPDLVPGKVKVKIKLNEFTSNEVDFQVLPTKNLKTIYWTNGHNIYKGDLNNGSFDVSLLYIYYGNDENEDKIKALTFDAKNEILYFLDDENIFSIPASGSKTAKTLLHYEPTSVGVGTEKNEFFCDLAINNKTNIIYSFYAVNKGSQKYIELIKFSPVDDSKKEVAYRYSIDLFNNPIDYLFRFDYKDITIDNENNKIYWAEPVNHQVMCMSMTSGSKPYLIASNLNSLSGIDIDNDLDNLYVIASPDKTKPEETEIMKRNLNNPADSKTIISTKYFNDNPVKNCLTVDSENQLLYFHLGYPTEEGFYNEQIVRCSPDGSNVEVLIDRNRDNICSFNVVDIAYDIN